ASLTETMRAPVIIGPGAALEYRNILVPVKPGRESEEAIDFAARLAAERRASIAALAVVVVPLEQPLGSETAAEEAERADVALDAASAIGELYGVDVTERLVRARSAGRAIVDDAVRRNSGIIALHALGFAPAVLFAAGLLFLLVSLSYAEGTAAIRETGGAATFVRIAFNDFWGFVTGWVLFLDYLIVIALSALFVPHYVAGAFFTKVHRPWDVVIGCGVIAGIAVVRLLHRTRLHRWALIVALVDLVTQLLIVVLGFALLFSPHALTAGTSLGVTPSWHSIAFAIPL